MNKWPSSRQQLVILVVALLACDLAQLVHAAAVGEIFTIPAVLVLPGATFLVAIRRPGDDGGSGVTQFATMVVVSLAVWPLLVLILAAASVSVTHASVLYAFNAAMVCGLTVASVTGWRLASGGAPDKQGVG